MTPELEKRLLEVAREAVRQYWLRENTHVPHEQTNADVFRPLLTEFYNAGLEAAAWELIVQGGLLKTGEERVDAIRALKVGDV